MNTKKKIGLGFIFFILVAYSLSCSSKLGKIVLDNISDLYTTISNYIYIDIKNKDQVRTIVIPSSLLYGSIMHYMYNENEDLFSVQDYERIVYDAIKNQKPIEVNDTLYESLSFRYVNKSLIEKYDTTDILNKGYILPNGRFIDTLKREDEKAIIYTLLRKNLMNCAADCESGRTFIFPDEPR